MRGTSGELSIRNVTVNSTVEREEGRRESFGRPTSCAAPPTSPRESAKLHGFPSLSFYYIVLRACLTGVVRAGLRYIGQVRQEEKKME